VRRVPVNPPPRNVRHVPRIQLPALIPLPISLRKGADDVIQITAFLQRVHYKENVPGFRFAALVGVPTGVDLPYVRGTYFRK
jgi:hypothetical protein